MRVDFSQRLQTLKGLPMYERSLEAMMVRKATSLMPEKQFATYEEIVSVLTEANVTLMDILKGEGAPLCLKDICVEALMLRDVHFSEELPGREEVIRYKLALAIMESKEPMSVKPSEVRLMQELVSHLPEAMGPIIKGQTSTLLEAGEAEESDANEPEPKMKAVRQEPKGKIPSRRG